MYRQAKRRVNLLRLIFLGALLLIVVRLAKLQLLHHQFWFYKGFQNRERVLPRPVRRGSIKDRQGRDLVWDEGAHDIELVYRDFRRGNPLGQAFHLYLNLCPDPASLDRVGCQWMKVRNLENAGYRLAKKRAETERLESRAELDRQAQALATEVAAATAELTAMGASMGTIPDPRRRNLFWAVSPEGMTTLVEQAFNLGSRDLPITPEAVPPELAARGISIDDLSTRARIIRGNLRFYMIRLLAGVLRQKAESDPALPVQWGGTPERYITREWRRKITNTEIDTPSFARTLGIGKADLDRLIRSSRAALIRLGDEDDFTRIITVLDRRHRRNVCRVIMGEAEDSPEKKNLWRLWDRKFRDRLRFYEDRRDPLWRYVDYETVKKIGLRPRAHRGFIVVNSVRRVYRQVADNRGRSWTPAVRLFGGVSGNRPETNLDWVDQVEISDLGDYEESYRRLLKNRALRLGERIWRSGASGLERSFDEQLRGREAYEVSEVDREGRRHGVIPIYRGQRRPGKDVRITVDLTLQKALETALGDVCRNVYGQAGAAVLDCNTGDVLALASYPLLTREEYSKRLRLVVSARNAHGSLKKNLKDWSDTMRAKAARGSAFREEYAKRLRVVVSARTAYRDLKRALDDWSCTMPANAAPGSTFKVVTALAGLRAGKAQGLHCPRSFVTAFGKSYKCDCKALGPEPQNLENAVRDSCNVFFGQLAKILPAGALKEEAIRLGCRPVGEDVPGLYGNLTNHWSWTGNRGISCNRPSFAIDVNDSSMGIGYRVSSTPLAMARIYATVATGKRPPLRVWLAGPVGERVSLDIPHADLARLRQGLSLVVTGGTASRVGLPAEVCGKTGTAEIFNNRSQFTGNNAWFAGYYPRQKPRISFAVLVPKVQEHGADAAGPVVKSFLQQAAVKRWLARKDGR